MPKTLCGTEVETDLLKPLLPDGEKLRVRDGTRNRTTRSCNLLVDDADVFYVRGDVVPPGTDPIKVKDHSLHRSGSPRRVDIGDDTRIADDFGLATVSCPDKAKGSTLAVGVDLETDTPKDTAERRKALENFLRAYLPRQAEAQGCGH